LTTAEHNDVFRDVHQAMAEHWAAKLLPKHFKQNARAIYKYRRRQARTIRRKQGAAAAGQAALGGSVDLVWSGLLMRAVLGYQEIKATHARGTVRMFGPSYLRQRPIRNQPDMAAEITTVIPSEIKELEQVAEAAYSAAVSKLHGSKIKTFGSPTP
jgi:hypothetical protein